jgi:hypothetical protein
MSAKPSLCWLQFASFLWSKGGNQRKEIMVLAFFILLRAWLFVVHLPRSLVPHCERLVHGSLLLASFIYFFGGMKKKAFWCIHSLDFYAFLEVRITKKFLLKFVVVPLEIYAIWIQFSCIHSLIQILGGGADDDDDDRMLMERITKSFPASGGPRSQLKHPYTSFDNKGCVSHCGLAILH